MRTDRLDRNGVPVNYMTLRLTFGRSKNTEAEQENEFTLEEITRLAANPDTALLAVSLEMAIIRQVIYGLTTENLFDSVQRHLKQHPFLFAPIRSRVGHQALENADQLARNPTDYLARLTENERFYLSNLYADSTAHGDDFSRFNLDKITTALQEFEKHVMKGGFATNRVFTHYLANKGAFPEQMALALRREVSLIVLAGKTSVKQLRSKLKKTGPLTDAEIERELSLCLGACEWVAPRDLEFAEALLKGPRTLDDMTARCSPATLLHRLIDSPPKVLGPTRLSAYPQLILDLCDRCPGALATRGARHLSQSLMSGKLLRRSELPLLLERLAAYDVDPLVGQNLGLLRFATARISAAELSAVIKSSDELQTALRSLNALLVKDPLALRQALLALDQPIRNNLTRRIGQVFSDDLGL